MIKKIKKLVVIAFSFLALTLGFQNQEEIKVGFSNIRGFSTLPSTTATDVSYEFGVVNIPTERVGAASSSTGFEFGKVLVTSATAFTVASTSTGFAFTVNQSGKLKGCAFDLQTLPNTGTVSVQIQKNGTLQSGKYCKLPRTGTFATEGEDDDMSTNETFLEDNITFVAGDRFGLIASSSNLNAATFDGNAKLIIQLQN